MTPARLRIQQAHILDPASQLDQVADLYIENGILKKITSQIKDEDIQPDTETISGKDKLVLPGLVDTCFSLGSSSGGYIGSIPSETRAAAAGGITHLACMPDASPILDDTASVGMITEKATNAGFCKVLPLGAMTQGLEGELLTEMQALHNAGCIGFSHAGFPIRNALTLKRCLEYAATFDLPVFFRPEDASLSANGCAHEGALATRLGLPSIPAVAETVDLARDLLLIEETGVRAHFHQISSAQSIPLLKQAKAKGLRISADVSIHHLLLNDQSLKGYNAHCHVRPPLRDESDRQALLEAVLDGTIDAICSQHLPRELAAKSAPFPDTAPGISGAEHLLSLTLKLANEIQQPLARLLPAITSQAAQCLELPAGKLETGKRANLCMLDPQQTTHIKTSSMISAGNNTPWLGSGLPGQVQLTVCDGHTSWLSD